MAADDLVVANLLRLAAGDLEDARLLASRQSRNGIYHCAQAAEKVIKAVLVSEAKRATASHLLDELVDQVPDENPVKPLLRALEDLGRYLTTYRYPTTSGRLKPPPTADEFETEAAHVQAALAEVAKRLGVDLTKANAPVTKPGPIRS